MKRIKIKISFPNSSREKFYSIFCQTLGWFCCLLSLVSRCCLEPHSSLKYPDDFPHIFPAPILRSVGWCIHTPMARPNNLYPLDCGMEKSQMYFPQFYCRTFSQVFFFLVLFSSLCFAVFTRFDAALQNIYSFYNVHCRQWEVHDAPNTINNNTICRLFLQNLQSACKHTVRAACDKFGFINNEITSVGNPLFHMPFRLSAWKFWFELVFAANFSLPENAWFVVRNEWNSEKKYLQNAVRPENDVSCGIRNALKFVGMNGMCWLDSW